MSFIFSHESPPSSDRYNPFPAKPVTSPSPRASTNAYTMSGLLRLMPSPMRPFSDVGKPSPETSVQLSPPSSVFHRPEPGPPD